MAFFLVQVMFAEDVLSVPLLLSILSPTHNEDNEDNEDHEGNEDKTIQQSHSRGTGWPTRRRGVQSWHNYP